MQDTTQEVLFASVAAFLGSLAIAAWAIIDPYEVALGLLVSFILITIDLHYSEAPWSSC
jgi:hypothetical protein